MQVQEAVQDKNSGKCREMPMDNINRQQTHAIHMAKSGTSVGAVGRGAARHCRFGAAPLPLMGPGHRCGRRPQSSHPRRNGASAEDCTQTRAL